MDKMHTQGLHDAAEDERNRHFRAKRAEANERSTRSALDSYRTALEQIAHTVGCQPGEAGNAMRRTAQRALDSVPVPVERSASGVDNTGFSGGVV